MVTPVYHLIPGLDLLLLHWCQCLQKPSLDLLLNWEWRKSCAGLAYKMIDFSWSLLILEANCLPKLIVKLDTYLFVLIGLQTVCQCQKTCPSPSLHLFESLIIYLWIFRLIISNNWFRKHILHAFHMTCISPKSLNEFSH